MGTKAKEVIARGRASAAIDRDNTLRSQLFTNLLRESSRLTPPFVVQSGPGSLFGLGLVILAGIMEHERRCISMPLG